ncbi:MAG: hypothetical protein WBX19_20090 [Terracidiphilus sp.]|jgi:hypothetical protein
MHMLAMLLQDNPQLNPDAIRHIVMAMMALIPIIIVITIAIVMIPCWFILKKAGFSPWLSLLCLIPSLGTLVLLYVLAFAEWKVIPAPQSAYPPPYPPPPQPPYPPQA